MGPTATRRKGGRQEWRERADFGQTDTQQSKPLLLGKRWSHKVKERMHSTDVAFRNESGSKRQPASARGTRGGGDDMEKDSGAMLGPRPGPGIT